MREQTHHRTCLNKQPLSSQAAPGTPNLQRLKEADVHIKKRQLLPQEEKNFYQEFQHLEMQQNPSII